MKATDLPNWMKSAVQRGDSWRERRWVNKERPSPPGGGVNCNNDDDVDDDDHSGDNDEKIRRRDQVGQWRR